MEGADFGSRLSGFRKKYRLSQKDLAQKLHVHITTIKTGKAAAVILILRILTP